MAFSKEHIIEMIRRTAAENDGVPLGSMRFEAATGIRIFDCVGVYWRRWNDAITEAGLTPNALNAAIGTELLLRRLVELSLTLGRAPLQADLRLARKADQTFPSYDVYTRRFRGAAGIRAAVRDFISRNPEFIEAATLYAGESKTRDIDNSTTSVGGRLAEGYVYLFRHGAGRDYKIGKTFSTLRRLGETRLELPEAVNAVHSIATDDPSGVEAYWHRRFQDKRKNGEWFSLDAADVAAFKRWKRIY